MGPCNKAEQKTQTALIRRMEEDRPSYGAMQQSRAENSNNSLDKEDGGR
jgi:hypothetical protein